MAFLEVLEYESTSLLGFYENRMIKIPDRSDIYGIKNAL